MQVSLQGKNVLITGGVRGIGRAMTEALAKAGAQVIATYVSNKSVADDFVGGLKGQGLKAHACKMDVCSSKEVDDGVAAIEAEYGPIDVLINNAGIVKDDLMMAMEDAGWQDVINTNLGGAFYVTRAVSRQMMRKRSGNIINVSSVAASRPGRGQVNYAASKGGMIALTKSLALSLGQYGITVNGLNPGMTDTPLARDANPHLWDEKIALDVLGSANLPEQAAQTLLFLAGVGGSFTTGQILGTRLRHGQ